MKMDLRKCKPFISIVFYDIQGKARKRTVRTLFNKQLVIALCAGGSDFRSLSLSSHQQLTAVQMDFTGETTTPAVVKLKPVEATPDNFKEFGQVIQASPDGEEFGPLDAQLDLSRGTPRFYIMQLRDRELKFSKITHHASVTQCLGSIGGQAWYLGVAKSTIVDLNGVKGDHVLQSRSGHLYVPPAVEHVHVFKITGSKFVKLNQGTWHAGPLFQPDSTLDFYNLELSNTNVVDHTTHDFIKNNGVVFVLDE